MKCNLPTDIDFGHNFYLSKISSNTTELRGNLTLNRPMSDNLTVSY